MISTSSFVCQSTHTNRTNQPSSKALILAGALTGSLPRQMVHSCGRATSVGLISESSRINRVIQVDVY